MVATTTLLNGGTAAASETAPPDTDVASIPSASGIIHIGADQPSKEGGCNWLLSGTHSDYRFAGELQRVDWEFQNVVLCDDGHVGFLFNTSRLYYNGGEIATGTPASCAQGPCTYSISPGEDRCVVPIPDWTCSGDYMLEADFFIGLQPPYYWPEPAPAGCRIEHNRINLRCTIRTQEVNIPEFKV